IHLARLIGERAPDLWAQLLANRDTGHVQAQLDRFEPLELVGRFGGGQPSAIIGCLCGYDAKNPNQAYLFDLDAMDPKDLIAASEADLMAAMNAQPRPLRSISINKVPMLLPPATVADEQLRRARILAGAPELRQRLIAAIAARYPADTGIGLQHVEQQIFNGFYSWNDKARLKEFQGADWPRRQEIVATFEDARLRQLGTRLVAIHAPKLMSDNDRRRYNSWRRDRWNGPAGIEVEWMTLKKAREAFVELKTASAQGPAMLEEIEAFISELEADIASGEQS
ncbi:MAG: hypothetical protein RIQ75_1492, partial [Pseudomonadota bacterium]